MAIAFDAAVAAQTDSTDPTWSHTCTGSNGLLVVTGDAAADYTSITYNSVALTKAVTVTSALTTRIQIWYLLNPSTGANTIVVTGGNGRCQSSSYTGVGSIDATASVADSARVGAGNITVALSVVATGCWVVGNNEDTTLNPTGGVIITARRGGETVYGGGRVGDSDATVSTGSIAVGYSYAGSNTASIVCMSFAPFVAAVGSNPRRLMTGIGA